MTSDYMDIYSSQADTLIHPFAAVAVLVLGLAVLTAPRARAALPMLLLACFVPSAQRIVVAGLDFNLLRILVVFGWARIILTREITNIRLVPLDRLVIAWSLSMVVFHTWQQGTTAAFVSKLGSSFDAIGFYFYFRSVIRSVEDIKVVAKQLGFIAVPVAMFFLIEWKTGHNIFSVFGGVPDLTVVRAGRLRVQGAFSHPILAGCFWAATFPLILSIWKCQKGRRERVMAGIGTCAAAAIVYLTASSTPLIGLVVGIVALGMFVFRFQMRIIQFGGVAVIAGLDIVMKARVWHLISRVNVTGGSTGYHRYQLIDSTIAHFDEWWLNGTANIDHWNIFSNDVTNQYVAEAITGGLVTLILFVIMILLAFSGVGRAWRALEDNDEDQFFVWSVGAALFVHSVNFIGVSYFGQIRMLWYLSLAIGGALTAIAADKRMVSTYPGTLVPEG